MDGGLIHLQYITGTKSMRSHCDNYRVDSSSCMHKPDSTSVGVKTYHSHGKKCSEKARVDHFLATYVWPATTQLARESLWTDWGLSTGALGVLVW